MHGSVNGEGVDDDGGSSSDGGRVGSDDGGSGRAVNAAAHEPPPRTASRTSTASPGLSLPSADRGGGPAVDEHSAAPTSSTRQDGGEGFQIHDLSDSSSLRRPDTVGPRPGTRDRSVRDVPTLLGSVLRDAMPNSDNSTGLGVRGVAESDNASNSNSNTSISNGASSGTGRDKRSKAGRVILSSEPPVTVGRQGTDAPQSPALRRKPEPPASDRRAAVPPASDRHAAVPPRSFSIPQLPSGRELVSHTGYTPSVQPRGVCVCTR
jgi:hypothetical protein